MGEDPYSTRMLRNEQESAKLNLQHRVYTNALGYLIHPIVNDLLVSGSKIADIGCGTGVFLRDLSEQLKDPSIQYQGFDISDHQFPTGLASSISLNLGDAKKGFPSKYLGQFDVVHIRLLFVAINHVQDWYNIARNALALLRLGGYLQWEEGTLNQVENVLCAVPRGDHELSALLREATIQMHKFCPMDILWAGKNLASTLKAAGAMEVRHDMTSMDRVPEERQALTRLTIEVFRTLTTRPAMAGVQGAWNLQRVHEIHARMVRLAGKEKVYVRYDIHTFVARKALNTVQDTVAMKDMVHTVEVVEFMEAEE